VHQRHRQQTDNRQQTDRQTDGRLIAYSERNVVRSLKTMVIHTLRSFYACGFVLVGSKIIIIIIIIIKPWTKARPPSIGMLLRTMMVR